MEHKGRKISRSILILAAMLLAAVLIGCCMVPYLAARSRMPEGVLTMKEQTDGRFLLSWPEGDGADFYRVEILDSENLLWQEDTAEKEILLPELSPEGECTIQVRSAVKYSWFGRERVRFGTGKLKAATVLRAPRIVEFGWDTDPDEKTLSIEFEMLDADFAVFSHIAPDGTRRELRRMEDSGRIDLRFGENGDFPMPDQGQLCELVMTVFRHEEDLEFYGAADIHVRIDRDDFLGRDLKLTMEQEGENVILLRWQETKGEYYQVQRSVSGQDWEIVDTVHPGQELMHRSEHLDSCEDYAYRVLAVGGHTMEGCSWAAISQEISFRTGVSTRYATIWPVKDLPVRTEPGSGDMLGTAREGKVYCVLKEVNGYFQVQVDGRLGYIDSNYCLINLTEYLGRLCSYDIRNSYDSAYLVHGFEIPNVTGVVTAGYENVLVEDGRFLVPLLYPTAQKLLHAAQSALEQGYRLKIYDAFRPKEATVQIYDLTAQILSEQLPEFSVAGETASQYQKNDAPTTYLTLMTNGTYQLNHFLAKGVSRHNLGVALDLTLEDAETGQEIPMQSQIHDLSWYSVIGRNNDSANVLASIMKSAGFATLSSEWWHFQDDQAKNAYSIPALSRGVSLEGWTRDDHGWMYRDSEGTCYKNQTLTLEGTQYRFDGEGYLVSSD